MNDIRCCGRRVDRETDQPPVLERMAFFRHARLSETESLFYSQRKAQSLDQTFEKVCGFQRQSLWALTAVSEILITLDGGLIARKGNGRL